MVNENAKYFQSLEGLRFVASGVIVIYHYSFYFQRRFLIEGSLAVDLFFVLSGFVITFGYSSRINTPRQYLIFVKKRLARLYPLHALTLCVYVLLAASVSLGLLRVVGPSKYKFSELIYNATLTHAWGFASGYSFNTVSWSISAELAAYLLFPVVLVVMRRGLIVGALALALVYAASICISHRLIGLSLPELSWDFGVLRAIPSFALGSWLYVNLETISSVFSDRLSVACFYISAIGWGATVLFSLNGYMGLISASLLVIFAAVSDHRGLGRSVSHPWLSNRGELTYSIYMLHPLVATVLISGIGAKLLGESLVAIAVTVIAAIGVTYIVAKVSYEHFEKPARRWCIGAIYSEESLRVQSAVPAGELR